MLKRTQIVSLVLATAALPALARAAEEADPFQWLEQVNGEKAIAWVKEQNKITTSDLEATKQFKPIYNRALEIYDSDARIPTPGFRGRLIYNFWQDRAHERGIWRRTTLESYVTREPKWETVLDLDALSKAEGQPLVFKGATCLDPAYRRCMVALSRGGSDAVVQREFDTETKAFVEGGFVVPEAKSQVTWRDQNTLWVATNFGEGTLTSSGYPRLVKEWRRGTPLAEARTVFAGEPDDVGVGMITQVTPEGRYDLVRRRMTFFTDEGFLAVGSRLVRLDLPDDAEFQTIFRDHMLFSLRSDWTVGKVTYKQGSLLAVAIDDLLQGRRAFDVLFEPTERTSLESVDATRDHVVMTALDDVHGKLYRVAYAAGKWTHEEVPLPGIGSVSIAATSDEDDVFFFTYQDFLTPSSLFLAKDGTSETVKAMPAFFDAKGMAVAQYEATSQDGTKVPYFVVTPKGFVANGKAPTLLYGYGGFEIAEVPTYSGVRGAAWLHRGGVFVLANIRGGGEFGPRWHQAALKEHRMRAFEDFIAVAEDLIARKITSTPHLGIMGGSNGGLLVGAAFTLRPDLFGAVVCQVPLLDMQRYTKLLAGASWMAEYGNPDVPADWAYIKTWSPYQNVKKDVHYPKVFFWTTTRDDRVHPGHARKMAAKMEAMGHPVYYFENIEGGHGAGSLNPQRALTNALGYSYLWKMLR